MAADPVGAVNGHGDEPKPPLGEPEPRFMLAAGFVLHASMAAGALAWLWLRDRLEILPARAIGERGPWLGSALGLCIGLLGARMLAFASLRLRQVRELEAVAGRSLRGASDSAAIAFVTVGAVAEELLFRLAVLDRFGLLGSVAVSAVVNSSFAGWSWLPLSLAHASVLGLMVQSGFGLLGSTTANAVMNYLNLRRIQCR